jgi:hypothetical protein
LLALHILALLGELPTTFCQLREADRLGLIGIEQARIRACDPLQP